MALEVTVNKRPEVPNSEYSSNQSASGLLHRIHALEVKDPAFAFRWFVYVPDAGGLYQCIAEKLTATFPKVPAKSRFTSGRVNYFPDNNEIDGLTITFYETYDYDVTRWLSRWCGKIVHEDGSYGVPNDYKKEIIAQLLLPGSDTPSLTLTYKGAWPTDRGAYNLAYDDESGRITVEAQFSVDELTMS